MGSFVNNITGGQPNNAQFAATGAPLMVGATPEQAGTAYQNAQNALAQQQALAAALQGQGAQGMSSQSALTQALMQQAQGVGPNPALAQLNQATGANTANQAALMAGQRGAGANVGLIARQAGQQGAANQQGAAGQAATLQAQQQLAAQGQLQNLAASQIGQQAGAVGAYNQAAQGEQGNLLNSINAQNNAHVGMQSNMNNANAALAQTNANNTASTQGGLLGGAGRLAMLWAHGGMVPDHFKEMAKIYHPNFAFGGPVSYQDTPVQLGSPSAMGNVTPGFANSMGQSIDKKGSDNGEEIGEIASVAATASRGGEIPGKPKMKGDHEENDTVPAKLSPGEVVIPNHIMQSDDPVGNAAKFVAEELKKHSGGDKDEEAHFRSALKEAIASRKKKNDKSKPVQNTE